MKGVVLLIAPRLSVKQLNHLKKVHPGLFQNRHMTVTSQSWPVFRVMSFLFSSKQCTDSAALGHSHLELKTERIVKVKDSIGKLFLEPAADEIALGWGWGQAVDACVRHLRSIGFYLVCPSNCSFDRGFHPGFFFFSW